MELLKTSWPFDSDPNVTYDDLGYPILDRAVGADTLQRTFDKFFSDGVFSTSDFRISAASGLSVNIQPGMCIINGGMAGWWDEPKVVALSATAPQWLTHYAIFLRYDNNDDMRGIYLRIDASAAGASVPEPVSAANVTELRIGYVTVPANATDLSGATFHNEVGTSKAPITMPLFDIDPIPILEDLRERADAAYQAYYDLLISAVDGTTAGHLQAQIDAQGERITELENQEIDPQTLRKEMGLGDTLGVLPVANGGTGAATIDDLVSNISARGISEQVSIPFTYKKTSSTSISASSYITSLGNGLTLSSPSVSVPWMTVDSNELRLAPGIYYFGCSSVKMTSFPCPGSGLGFYVEGTVMGVKAFTTGTFTPSSYKSLNYSQEITVPSGPISLSGLGPILLVETAVDARVYLGVQGSTSDAGTFAGTGKFLIQRIGGFI